MHAPGQDRLGAAWRRSYAATNAGQLASGHPAVSVITKRVDPKCKAEYQDWQNRMNQLVSRQPGFLSAQGQVSATDETLNVLILSFESQEDLDTWIASDARNAMLDEASGFHALTSVQQMDTSAWGMVVGPGKPAPPIWKNTLLVFSALYPTVTFTKVLIEPCLAMLPCWSAFHPEVTSMTMIGIVCIIMNAFSMKIAFAVIGPRLFPLDTLVRTTLKVAVLFGWAGLFLAVQIPELRGAMVGAIKDAIVSLTI